ncbi:MAG: hypothetical protein ACOYIP_03230 [Coriobacteriales bacterium]|jgi:hypothetical protein
MDLKSGIGSVIEANTSPRLQKSMLLQEVWEQIAPEKALRHTDNVIESKKRDGAIAIFVDTPHAAADLAMSKEYYRQRFEIELGEPVTDVFFVVSKETGIRKEFVKREQEQPWYVDNCESVPLDEGELAYARLSVEGIEDEKLRETLLKAFISDMEWKKGLKASKSL